MSESLLGKKRETTEEEKDKAEKKVEKKSLFGNAPTTGGLFGNLNSTSTEKKSLFSNFSFGDKNQPSSFFNSGSLFNDPKISKGSSLFSTFQNNDAFCKNKEENSDDDEDGEGELCEPTDNIEAYKPDDSTPANTEFNRVYVKQVENLYIFSKDENKFVSKGKGFISLEQHKEKLNYIFVFRNTMGVILLSGVFTEGLKKVEKVTKNFKNIASFACIELDKSNKPVLKFCKIPVSYLFLILLAFLY